MSLANKSLRCSCIQILDTVISCAFAKLSVFMGTVFYSSDFVLATFRKSRNPEEKKELIKKKIALIYEMFDVNSDGQITRYDIVILLRHMMGNKVCISTISKFIKKPENNIDFRKHRSTNDLRRKHAKGEQRHERFHLHEHRAIHQSP